MECMSSFGSQGGIFMHANTSSICQKYFLNYIFLYIFLNIKTNLGFKKSTSFYNVRDKSAAEMYSLHVERVS